MIVLYVFLAILILMFMIMIHEFGHYLAGKLLKFKIEEFSIGFGKALFSKTMKSGEVFSIRLIPLGGYCAFKGEDEDEDEDGKPDPDCFNNFACWKRIIVLISGALFNLLSGFIFTFVLLLTLGTGNVKITGFRDDCINKDKLAVNDIIIEVDGVEPTFLNGGINGLLASREVGEDIVLKIDRNGEILDVVVQKYETQVENDKGEMVDTELIGITNPAYVPCSFGKSLVQAVPYTFKIAWECLRILGGLFTGTVGVNNLGGPVTTVKTIAVSAQANMSSLILLFPLIAVNLAVFNILPIPALDGARVLFVAIEWIMKKPVSRDLEAQIHNIGLMVLFSLVVVIDILQIFVF